MQWFRGGSNKQAAGKRRWVLEVDQGWRRVIFKVDEAEENEPKNFVMFVFTNIRGPLRMRPVSRAINRTSPL
jgi:hypothetical protein